MAGADVANQQLERIGVDAEGLALGAERLADEAARLTDQVAALGMELAASGAGGHSFVIFGLTVLVLACFVGYYVVWSVTPALHSPLMGVTNAVSSVIIVGALIAAGPPEFNFSSGLGLLAVFLASINIFGGFAVTQRMLSMFRKKQR